MMCLPPGSTLRVTYHLARPRYKAKTGPRFRLEAMPETMADTFAARIRELEEAWLSPLAVRSYDTRGRLQPEEESPVRTPFQRDRDRIVHPTPFRRLHGKP